MVPLTSLWTPIFLSAFVVFLASFVTHMLLTHHRADYRAVPDEDALMDAVRTFNLPPGDYLVPRPKDMADMRSPEFVAKMKRGPRFMATIFPASVGMGPQLAQWFLFCVVVSLFAGYIGSRSLPPGAEYLRVSQMVSATAFVGYVLARWSDVIWYHKSLGSAVRFTIDGLLYAFLTGGVFGWLWPATL